MSDYVDMNKQQKTLFNKGVDEIHLWHRETQLPVYADYLEQMKLILLSPDLNTAIIDDMVTASSEVLAPAKERFIPLLETLFISLSDRQIKELDENLREYSDEYAEDYVEPNREKRVKKRSKWMRGITKTWLGRLSPEQKELIVEWSNSIHTAAELTWEEQGLWREQFDRVLNEREVYPENINLFLQEYFFDKANKMSAEHQQLFAQNREYTFQLIVDLITMASDKQRKHLKNEFDDLVNDLIELSED
jgi:hypothetical protein